MPTDLFPEVLKLGLAGVVILVLAYAVRVLYTQVIDLQAARIADSLLRINDQKEHAAENLKAAELITQALRQSELREEANIKRWEAIEKIDESTRATAGVLGTVVERQSIILQALKIRDP